MKTLHVQQRRASAPAPENGDSATVEATGKLVHRAFRFRLYPTEEQAATLRQYADVCRLIYNLGFEQRRDFWRQYRRTHGRSITYASQSAELTQLRGAYDWIAAVPSEAESYALQDLDRAFANFFAGRANYPKPRRRDQGHGFRLKGRWTPVRKLNANWAEVRIQKLGWIRYRATRPIIGTVRNVSFSRTAGEWFVSFAADFTADERSANGGSVGVDLGVAQSVTLSSGEHFQAPSTDAALKRLARAQRDLARKTKGSARRAKQAAKVAKLHAKIARSRKEWAHETTTAIARQHGYVVAEDLNVRGMTASASGSVEEPGTGVAQKRGLNRAILAQGWGAVTHQLAYKLEGRGGQLVFVDPKHSSQTCSACGVIDGASRVSQAVFQCVACGHEANADVNAAREILRRGLSPASKAESRGKGE